MTYLLVAVLALSAGWCWGHATARIRHIPIGATAAQDAVAIDLAAACCERWWTSAGAEHDTEPLHPEGPDPVSPNQTGPARQGSTERCANHGCGHTKRDHSGRRDHQAKGYSAEPWCHACESECLFEPAAPVVSEEVQR